jgi:small subunit ribosomal protein S17
MELIGKVVSTKMNKTVLVEIERLVTHPLYKKRIKKTKRFKAYDEIGVKIEDKVKIVSTRPTSKDKHFKVEELIEK